MLDRVILPTLYTLPMGGKGKVVVLEEAHGLKGEVMRRLLDLLEKIPSHATVIFTTTIDGQAKLFDSKADTGPLLSRCFRVNITGQGLCKPVARWLKAKAAESGLNGEHPLSWFERRMTDNNNNIRGAIQDTVRMLAMEATP